MGGNSTDLDAIKTKIESRLVKYMKVKYAKRM